MMSLKVQPVTTQQSCKYITAHPVAYFVACHCVYPSAGSTRCYLYKHQGCNYNAGGHKRPFFYTSGNVNGMLAGQYPHKLGNNIQQTNSCICYSLPACTFGVLP